MYRMASTSLGLDQYVCERRSIYVYGMASVCMGWLVCGRMASVCRGWPLCIWDGQCVYGMASVCMGWPVCVWDDQCVRGMADLCTGQTLHTCPPLSLPSSLSRFQDVLVEQNGTVLLLHCFDCNQDQELVNGICQQGGLGLTGVQRSLSGV